MLLDTSIRPRCHVDPDKLCDNCTPPEKPKDLTPDEKAEHSMAALLLGAVLLAAVILLIAIFRGLICY